MQPFRPVGPLFRWSPTPRTGSLTVLGIGCGDLDTATRNPPSVHGPEPAREDDRRIATREDEDRPPTPEEQGKDPAAMQRGRMGGLKGAAARAESRKRRRKDMNERVP
jgi:hypothetical protein